MENKDWRKQFENEFAGWWDYKSAMTERIVDSIESLLKSKQEEIEGEMGRIKRLDAELGDGENIIARDNYFFNLALDDLKPIISNILK